MGEEREDDDIQIIEQSPENRGKLRDILQQKGDLSDPKPKIPIMKKRASHITNQILASFAVSFGPFAVGLGKGYTSPALASMQSENQTSLTTLTITEQQGSWIASLSLLGALFGGLFAGLVIKHGRRKTLCYITLPFASSWTLTMFATCVEMIYLTAFLVGFFSAIVQLATQVYISEIADPTIRASLCSAAKVLSHIGLLSSFALGAFLDWRQLACVCAGSPIMLFITSRFIPETPSFLLYNNEEEKAEKALQWLRGSNVDVSAELATIHCNIKRMKEQGSSCKTVLVPQLVRPLLITCGLMFFHRFSGVAAFNFYAVTIFRDSFGSFNPHLAAVVTGSIQLLASCVSGILCDIIGRLPLLILSTALMSSALAGFGCYSYYFHDNLASNMDWIPLMCVILFVCSFSLGMNPISWLLIGEVFALEYRNIGPAMTTAFSYICAFVGVKTFVDLRNALGLHGTFWAYSVISVIGLLYSLIFVPETKGITLDEMAPKASILKRERSRNKA